MDCSCLSRHLVPIMVLSGLPRLFPTLMGWGYLWFLDLLVREFYAIPRVQDFVTLIAMERHNSFEK
jgi:hypothetical protein